MFNDSLLSKSWLAGWPAGLARRYQSALIWGWWAFPGHQRDQKLTLGKRAALIFLHWSAGSEAEASLVKVPDSVKRWKVSG